jgi:SpoU rRNA methylase family enzyme
MICFSELAKKISYLKPREDKLPGVEFLALLIRKSILLPIDLALEVLRSLQSYLINNQLSCQKQVHLEALIARNTILISVRCIQI